jgi:hypothetical protein
MFRQRKAASCINADSRNLRRLRQFCELSETKTLTLKNQSKNLWKPITFLKTKTF